MALGDINGHSRVSAYDPQAAAVCDRCSRRYNLSALRRQFQWAGTTLLDTGFLVCRRCLDTPFEQYRSIILPPDPVPRMNPRPDVQATPIYYPGSNEPTTPGNQNFLQYILGTPNAGTYPTDKPDVLAAVAAITGVPTPAGIVDRSITITPANTTLTLMADGGREWLLIYNPAQPVCAFNLATALWGSTTNLMIGPGEAWFASSASGNPPWTGAITAIGLTANVPLYAWESA
jgi:hypothetical protein